MVITMPNIATLYIIQVSYTQLEQRFAELKALQRDNDAFVLLEDSVFAIINLTNDNWKNTYLLQADAHLLTAEQISAHSVNIIDYIQFAELIAKSNKVITWK